MKSTILALALVLCANALPARAQSLTYVSNTGSDANSCIFDNEPCRTLQGAYNKTNAGGRIACMSSGNFSVVEIGKSITIDCTGYNARAAYMIIDGVGITVTVRGIQFFDRVTPSTGIIFINGSSLHVESCTFSQYNAGTAAGIYFRPSGAARLYVTDSEFTSNGAASSGGGIVIHPQGSGSAVATLNRVTLNGNRYGIFAQGLASNGPIVIDVRDSSISGSTEHGMVAITDTSLAAIVVQRSSIVQNGGTGIRAEGPGALVHVGSSTVRGNAVGLGVSGGGQILSFQNNEVAGNGVDGAPTGVLTMK